MLTPKSYLAAVVSLMTSMPAFALNGDVATFMSPNGIEETCIALAKIPDAKYSDKDLEKEAKFCAMNFYDNSVALCAKTWSTSPGTIVNKNTETGLDSVTSEAKNCPVGKENPLKSLAKFKQSMNASGTSGTNSTSSLFYYHFSRVLDTTVSVPVAVYRTMDVNAHYDRVTSKARPSKDAEMNYAAWQVLKAAEKNPASYGKMWTDVFTADQKQVYGVLLKDKGERYGAEFNGTRASGWGDGQNFDIQKTPAFLALKSAAPLKEAIAEGIAQAFKDPKMADAFKTKSGLIAPSEAQMVLWMREMSEIAILDYIMNQQDRVGNIDFKWEWAYLDENGKVENEDENSEVARKKMDQIKVPAKIAQYNPILLQRTEIGDNDAGASPRYRNFAKRTGMLDGVTEDSKKKGNPIRHLHPTTYKRLVYLAQDFAAKGPQYQAFVSSFGLDTDRVNSERFDTIVANTQAAANIFIGLCKSGELKFDIVSYKDILKGKTKESKIVDCEIP